MSESELKPDNQLSAGSSVRPKYRREPSLALLCVPACLNMILVRRGCSRIPQTEIARTLGLVVPQRLSDIYQCPDVSENPGDWGVSARTAESGIRATLARYAPNLHHVFRRWQEVPGTSQLDFIADHLSQGNDLAVGFRASNVYDDCDPVGHVALIMEVNPLFETVRLMDPEVGTDDGVVVSWVRLFPGIIAAHDGYWLFGDDLAALTADAIL